MRKNLGLLVCVILIVTVVFSPMVSLAAKAPIGTVASPKSFRLVTEKAGISYKVTKKSATKLEILSTKSVLVRSIKGKTVSAGKTAVFKWDGRDQAGHYVSAGVYRLKLYAGTSSITKNIRVMAAERQKLSKPKVSATALILPDPLSISCTPAKKNDIAVQIMDAQKNTVAELYKRNAAAGKSCTLKWDGKVNVKDDPVYAAGEYAPPGAYTVKIVSGSATASFHVKITHGASIKKPELFLGDQSVTIGERADTVLSSFGSPQRIDHGQYGFSYYVYNSNPLQFLMVGVQNGKVVSYYTAAAQFNYKGLTQDSTIDAVNAVFDKSYALDKSLRYTDGNHSVTVYMDTLGAGNAIGIEVLPSSAGTASMSAPALRGMEMQVFDITNAFRAKSGLPILQWSAQAQVSAMKHSEDMAKNNYFDHTSLDGRTFGQRMRAEGISYSTAGENISAGHSGAPGFANSWINSAGHRGNMLTAAYQYLGVGIGSFSSSTYKNYATQNFYA